LYIVKRLYRATSTAGFQFSSAIVQLCNCAENKIVISVNKLIV